MESIWSQSCTIPQRQPLTGDLEVEAAVIGEVWRGFSPPFCCRTLPWTDPGRPASMIPGGVGFGGMDGAPGMMGRRINGG